MYVDSKQAFSDGQALTATAVSTNVIDLGVERNIGPGEHMAVMVSSSVDAGGTSPSLQVVVQTDDNEGFSSATTLATSGIVLSLSAGQKIIVPIGIDNQRYLRLNLITGGTSPTHTIDAYLTPYNMVDAKTDYANGYDIT